jgi:hypothetical protein
MRLPTWTDQMFALRQILEKTREYNITNHHLFIDFKAAHDLIVILDAMTEFNFPDKLIHISNMILARTLGAVKIDGCVSNNFRTPQDFVQGDGVSCDFFNIALEKVIQDAGINTRGTIFRRSHQILEHADDLVIIARHQRELESLSRVRR